MTSICGDDERRALVRQHQGADGQPDWYGLDYLEVSNDELTLYVYFLGKLPPALRGGQHLDRHVRIDGGERITGINVLHVTPHLDPDPTHDDYMTVRVDRPGDFSTYTLTIVDVPQVDSRLSSLDFSFKIDCPSDVDCVPDDLCPPAVYERPDINYLAKDYASFRQVILDRLAILMPDWQERHVPDIGIALVEVMAYVGDYLSYYQDSVATEAYLDTARQRISVRRHARLIDYLLHEGNNARTWVYLKVAQNVALDPQQIAFLAGFTGLTPDQNAFIPVDRVQEAPAGTYEVFEVLDAGGPIQTHTAHNQIVLYTWGDRECCLPVGATSATLRDTWHVSSTENGSLSAPAPTRELALQPGDFLLFEEIVGPRTGIPGDADPKHRHVVRLTRVQPSQDDLFTDPDTDLPVPLLEVEWAREDALPFPLCISSIGEAPECAYIEPVSVARGNIILVDQGQTVGQDLPDVPAIEVGASCDCEGIPSDVEYEAGPYDPHLASGPLIFSEPATGTGPASILLAQNPQRALPSISLTSTAPAEQPITWLPVVDLLGSGPDNASFVVEMDGDRTAHLRFGDGRLGRRLMPGAAVHARYRAARSTARLFGAGAIAHITTSAGVLANITEVRNPLPAVGPTDPQTIKEAKLIAPSSIRSDIERAVTANDYALITGRDFGSAVQRAAAELEWTGSWYEADVAVDPLGVESADQAMLDRIAQGLDRYRRIGHDLRMEPAQYVPLDIALAVCVKDDYLRGHVKAALEDTFSNRVLPGGRRGFFHPDNLTFGQGVYLSPIIAAAQAVEGVESVQVTRFQRLFQAANGELARGVLRLGPFEIAQLDNDPSFPEHGRLTLDVRGGR